MDPESDCPICFETYTEQTEREQCTTPCCGQSLCLHCKDCLQCCPFCREAWSETGGTGAWLREGAPNPIYGVARFCIRNPVLTYALGQIGWNVGSAGVRSAVASASLMTAEASPVVIGGATVGLAAVGGGVALYAASRHHECQSQRLCAVIRNRRRRQLASPTGTYHAAAAQLFETIHWNLSPQKKGMPHVYHGSIWRSAARERHLSQVEEICMQAPPSYALSPSDRIWSDLAFCYSLWLEYNPHTANWGTCASYGSPPFGLCWHNRWREDLRHVLSDLASYFHSGEAVQSDTVGATERASALCLLVVLDHILSWQITSPGFGASDLLPASWHRYHDFCTKLLEQFALAWAAARAPVEEGGIDFSAYSNIMDVNAHVAVMAGREIPEGFRNVW